MVTARGILTETPAILAFIAQSFPQARLAPLGDPFAFAELQAFNSYLCSTLHIAHARRMRGYRWVDDPDAIVAMQKKVPQSVGECFELIDRVMLMEPWVMGENYTVANPYLFTIAMAGGRRRRSITHSASDCTQISHDGAANVRKAIAAELADDPTVARNSRCSGPKDVIAVLNPSPVRYHVALARLTVVSSKRRV